MKREFLLKAWSYTVDQSRKCRLIKRIVGRWRPRSHEPVEDIFKVESLMTSMVSTIPRDPVKQKEGKRLQFFFTPEKAQISWALITKVLSLHQSILFQEAEVKSGSVTQASLLGSSGSSTHISPQWSSTALCTPFEPSWKYTPYKLGEIFRKNPWRRIP